MEDVHVVIIGQGINNDMDNIICMKCGYEMKNIQVCHLKCFNCGAEMDCSDKGSVW